MSYSSLIKTLFALLALAAGSRAFVAPAVLTTASSSAASGSALGLFGGKKKADNPKKGETDQGFLAGKGARITVREDEDNAMWVDEPGDLKKGKGGNKKGGK